MERQCLVCSTAYRGRADKKFCSDQCRSSYHNRRNSPTNNLMRRINAILLRNRRVLARLHAAGATRISRRELLDRGFVFEYFTNEYRTGAGKSYRFCYDQGYRILETGQILLVLRREYVDPTLENHWEREEGC